MKVLHDRRFKFPGTMGHGNLTQEERDQRRPVFGRMRDIAQHARDRIVGINLGPASRYQRPKKPPRKVRAHLPPVRVRPPHDVVPFHMPRLGMLQLAPQSADPAIIRKTAVGQFLPDRLGRARPKS